MGEYVGVSMYSWVVKCTTERLRERQSKRV